MSGTSLGIPYPDYLALTVPELRITDYTLDENLPAIPAPTSTSTQPYYYTSHPSADLGSLDSLPIELLQIILPLLDLRTLIEFRRVNQRSLQLVAALPQYKVISSHALNGALRGALRIGMGQWITCNDLFAALCTIECKECGDYAGYLFLLTCTRVCFLCFTRHQNYLPLRYSHAREKFGLARQNLSHLPHMRSLSGTYTPMNKKSRDRISLIDYGSARSAAIALYGSLAAVEKEKDSQRPGRPHIPPSRRAMYEARFDAQSGNPLRFMAIVCVPWFNRARKDAERSFYCIGCQKSSVSERNWPMHFRRKFTVASFSKHLIQCGSIKDGKHQPNQHGSMAIE